MAAAHQHSLVFPACLHFNPAVNIARMAHRAAWRLTNTLVPPTPWPEGDFFDALRRDVFTDDILPIHEAIERRRGALMSDTRRIADDSPLASTKIHSDDVSLIARTSILLPRHGRLLGRLVSFLKPQLSIELGTCLGISGAYIAAGHPATLLRTAEGLAKRADIARETFGELDIANAEAWTGLFEDLLPEMLDHHPAAGFAFIDGNHAYEPTMRYFQAITERADPHCVLVFHDIHWSKDMSRAWREIRAHPWSGLSLDLYHLGIVFSARHAERRFVRLRS